MSNSIEPKQVAVTVVMDADLLKQVDERATELDLNRSQYLRRLARNDLALLLTTSIPQPQEQAA